jgi:hypothetical protein
MTAVVDLDGDGFRDLILAASTRGVEIHRGISGGFSLTPTLYDFGGQNVVAVATGDVTGDGLIDVAVADAGGNAVRVLIGAAGGLPATFETFAVGNPSGVGVIDVFGNGLNEITVSSRASRELFVIRRQADSWDQVGAVALPHDPANLATADLDRDGFTDVVVGTTDANQPLVLYGGPDGLGTPELVGPLASRGQAAVVIADLNADGWLDLAISVWIGWGPDQPGCLSLAIQTAPRVFAQGGIVPGDESNGAVGADLNGDGSVDLVSVTNRGARDLLQIHYSSPPQCVADLEPDGTLNFFDVAAFLLLFNAGDPVADFAEPFGVLNFFDLAAFLAVYNAGCP